MIYLISNSPYKDAIWLEVCKISFLKFDLILDEFENCIFTSKNGIKSLKFNKISPNLKIKTFCIGEATFKEAKDYGFLNLYLAKNSHGDEFTKEISPLLKGKTVFIKATQNASNVSEILKQNGINLSVINGYENLSLTLDISKKPPKNSILIFTSPKNVESFIKNFGWDDSYKTIVIGKTTSKILQNYTNPQICKTQSIKNCMNYAKFLEKSFKNY